MVKVYVAGPLTRCGEEMAVGPRRQLNVDLALAQGADLVGEGFNPYVPHYSHYLDLLSNSVVNYETWLAIDFEWLECCDVLLRMPGVSPGADREVIHAEKCHIPVVHTVEELRAFRDFYEHMPKGIQNAELRRLWLKEYKQRTEQAGQGSPRCSDIKSLKAAIEAAPAGRDMTEAIRTSVPAPSVSEQREQWLTDREAAIAAVAISLAPPPSERGHPDRVTVDG